LACIVLAKVLEAGEGTRQALFRTILSINLLSGVMVRMSSGRIWLRFSREAVGLGLTLEAIGMHLLSELKKERDRFEQVEVIFIVTGQDGVERLGPLADRIAEERRSRYNAALVEKMECETGLDCEECPESETCNVLKGAVAVAQNRNENR
jgi:CO dehydrogenase/acetyl-CoA synthase beta subunit